MKIYGQDFRDVFSKLPWQYKVVVAVGSAFVLFALIYIPFRIFSSVTVSSPVVEPLQIRASQPSSGVLDPSLAADPKTGTVWMAYASEEKGAAGNLLHVRMATAKSGHCAEWSQVPGGFEVKPDDILSADGQSVFKSGVWRVETPALVHDPDDAGREWKLYAYRYFWAQDSGQAVDIAKHYGVISYKYSSDPAKGWSEEQWLFSPAPDFPPPPYEKMVLLHLNRLDPSLKNVTAYSRPSAVYKDGALVMALSAFEGGSTPDRVIMIVSLDHGNSWRYVGTLLQKADLALMGSYTVLGGAALLEQEGRVYLAAVLGDDRQLGQGTFILGFDDFGRGILHRDPQTGVPVVLHHEPLHSGAAGRVARVGGGFAAYADACGNGMLTGEQGAGGKGFLIFKTLQKPAPEIK